MTRNLLILDEDLSYLPGEHKTTGVFLDVCEHTTDRLDLTFAMSDDYWKVCLREDDAIQLRDALSAWLEEREEAGNSKTRKRLTWDIAKLSDQIAELAEERAHLRRALDDLS